ncbi:hypothetical protein LCGC14_2003180 [marine sediment metagenome]|uniref:Uncharacterized protein n=1 Tax=marine sediment metagenome TaxID=412755 RepID=A0A0F9HZM7_9ZZZZ
MQRIITDNSEERRKIKWDGVRFALVEEHRVYTSCLWVGSSKIYSPREMDDIVEFVKEVKSGSK